MDASSFFAGKRVTVMGLGLLGRGVGDVRYLAEMGAEVIVTDLKTEAELASSVAALSGVPNVRFTLGEHRLEDFRDRDIVFRGPKVPLDSPYLAEAKAQGATVTMSTALFARLVRGVGTSLIGVTGTRGKTTTTEMIAHVLRSAGKEVILGGNIRGVSTLALLPQVTKETVAVLELDSWQLQGFRDERMSPEIAVFTTFYPDHMDYYRNDMDAYLADKAEIFLHQKPSDTFVLGPQAKDKVLSKYPTPPAPPTIPSVEDIADWKLQILGSHNLENAACARAALLAYGIADDDIREGLASFTGVPGRLELVHEVNGVQIYNDTTATTPEATVAALRAVSSMGKRSILIMGGTDKGLDTRELVAELPRHAKRVILLAGNGTDRLMPFVSDASVYGELKPAVEEAMRYASSGDVVLFSPGFTSFGMFKNEYDRGDQFNAIVRTFS